MCVGCVCCVWRWMFRVFRNPTVLCGKTKEIKITKIIQLDQLNSGDVCYVCVRSAIDLVGGSAQNALC